MPETETYIGITLKSTKVHGKTQKVSKEPYVSICNLTLFLRRPVYFLFFVLKELLDPSVPIQRRPGDQSAITNPFTELQGKHFIGILYNFTSLSRLLVMKGCILTEYLHYI